MVQCISIRSYPKLIYFQQQKPVGKAENWNYNSHIDMYSRETCSALPNGWITGLLVFLAAFLVGVLVAEAIRFLYI
jgi:hypothetical protein